MLSSFKRTRAGSGQCSEQRSLFAKLLILWVCFVVVFQGKRGMLVLLLFCMGFVHIYAQTEISPLSKNEDLKN